MGIDIIKRSLAQFVGFVSYSEKSGVIFMNFFYPRLYARTHEPGLFKRHDKIPPIRD